MSDFKTENETEISKIDISEIDKYEKSVLRGILLEQIGFALSGILAVLEQDININSNIYYSSKNIDLSIKLEHIFHSIGSIAETLKHSNSNNVSVLDMFSINIAKITNLNNKDIRNAIEHISERAISFFDRLRKEKKDKTDGSALHFMKDYRDSFNANNSTCLNFLKRYDRESKTFTFFKRINSTDVDICAVNLVSLYSELVYLNGKINIALLQHKGES